MRASERISRALPAAATAAAVLAQALAARLLLSADESRVYWLGRPVEWHCAFHERLGLPCPTCGLTRSVVLALHGHFARAWSLAPGGPAAVAAGLLFAAAIAALAVLSARGGAAPERFRTHLRRCALLGSGLVFAVWSSGWALAFARALQRHS